MTDNPNSTMKPLVIGLIIIASVSLAQAQSFTASLNGAQDGGGLRSGTGYVTLTLTGTALSLSGSFSGLSTNMTAGHIHGPAAPGFNASVIYDLVAPGILTGVGTKSGTYSGTVNLIPNPTGYTTIAQQLTDLNSGLWYLNIHSVTFGGGEIRGQILPVPEPSALGFAALGTGILACALRRRKG
jgi:hypothetical protein